LNRLSDAAIKTNAELGGHSTVWAVRSQIEGCGVYIAPTPNDYTVDSLKYAKSTGEHLEIPLNRLVEMSDRQKIDIHLVLEYNAGDSILGY